MSLLAELKCRNVIRMAGPYLVGAWLITQVSSAVPPMFGAPDWLPRSVLILLAIGFVPVLKRQPPEYLQQAVECARPFGAALAAIRRLVRRIGLADLWEKYGPPDLCHRVAQRDYACELLVSQRKVRVQSLGLATRTRGDQPPNWSMQGQSKAEDRSAMEILHSGLSASWTFAFSKLRSRRFLSSWPTNGRAGFPTRPRVDCPEESRAKAGVRPLGDSVEADAASSYSKILATASSKDGLSVPT